MNIQALIFQSVIFMYSIVFFRGFLDYRNEVRFGKQKFWLRPALFTLSIIIFVIFLKSAIFFVDEVVLTTPCEEIIYNPFLVLSVICFAIMILFATFVLLVTLFGRYENFNFFPKNG